MANTDDVPARFTDALDRLDGDVQLLREMASINSEDLPDVIRQAEQAIAEGECDVAAAALHRLKGMLSTFESEGVTLEIQEMLDSSRKSDMDSVRETFEQQKASIDELVEQIGMLSGKKATGKGTE